MSDSTASMRSCSGQPIGPLAAGKLASLAPEDSPTFHKELLDSLHDGVYFVDGERKITYWNRGAERLTGYTRKEAVGRHCYDDFLGHVSDSGQALCQNGCPLTRTITDGERREAEVYLRHKSGHRVPVSVRVAPIVDEDARIVGAVEVFNDITGKKNVERRAGELERLAFQDSLTGIPNRRYVELKVEQAIQECQIGRKVGLLMIDVDHFKAVNDTYGHDIGDSALKTVCTTIEHSLRAEDMVGRWGGEEFVVIAKDVNRTSLMAIAERCRTLIAESAISEGNKRFRVTVSLGATLFQNGDSEQSVLKRTDDFMYLSKLAGRNRTTLG